MQFITPPSHPGIPPDPLPHDRIVITGFGLVTPLGYAAWDTFKALLEGRSIADRSVWENRKSAMGSGKADAVARVRQIGCVGIAQHEPTDPAVVIAERAVREAACMAGVRPAGLPTFLGTSKGAVTLMHTAAAHAAHAAHDPPGPHLPPDLAHAIAMGPHAALSHHLTRRLGIVPRGHHVGACASSLIALDHARRWLLESKVQSPKVQSQKPHPPSSILHQPSSILHPPSAIPSPPSTALVLTAEAALLPLFIHSYRRLGVLADLTSAGYRQRPLDARRGGFMLAEMGAAVILQRIPAHAPAPPGSIELLDTATATEAHDMVRTAPAMPALRHVAGRLIADRPGRTPGLIHPHAPGTIDHDPAELAVYRDLCPTAVDLYAVKGAIGHGLGAAGLVSLVVACLCLKVGRRPPMPWLDQPMDVDAGGDDWPLRAPAAAIDPTLPQAVFAAGFAGHTAGALIAKADG